MTDSNVRSGFIAELRSQGMSEEHLSGFSHHVSAFCVSHPFLEPKGFTALHLKNHLAEEASRGTSEQDLRNRAVAIEALIDYVAATGAAPPPVAPVVPAAVPTPGHRRASGEPRVPVMPAHSTNVALPDERPTPLSELLLRPWSVAGVLASAGLVIPILCGFVPLIGWWLTWLYYPGLVGYYFLNIDHTGRGLPGMPRFESIDAQAIGPLFGRGIACVLAMMLPFVVVSIWGPAESSDLDPIMRFGSLAVGALLGPAVILSVYLTGSAFSAFHPGAWWRIIIEFRGDYARTAIVFALLSAAVAVVMSVTDAVLPEGLLGQALRAFLVNFFWLSQACVLGDFVRKNSHRLGIPI
ncbi:MAG: hypothetical protein KUG77_01210 [Nannocystaceae bacterium]|nr:hypothetical protein [Nannocystaceae bacterium]